MVIVMLPVAWGFSSGTVVKNPPANAGDTGDRGLILGQKKSTPNVKDLVQKKKVKYLISF